MGAPGSQIRTIVQTSRRNTLDDIAGFLVAHGIQLALADTQTLGELRAGYGLSDAEMAGIVKRLREKQRHVDPNGDWQ